MRKGDRVLAPFAFSDGTCEFCRKELQTSYVSGRFWGMSNDGGQAEMVRSPFADGTIVALPRDLSLKGVSESALLKAILPITDVMGTGHHAAISAGVAQGATVAVVGDGAVGLCGVPAAKKLGAARIIMLGHQRRRLELAESFGAADIIASRSEEAVSQAIKMTGGGADSVLECVGTSDALNTAIGIRRPGGTVGYVGVPHYGDVTIDFVRMFRQNIKLEDISF